MADEGGRAGLNALASFREGTVEEQRSAASLATSLRRFLDAAAAAKPDPHRIPALIEDLDRWADRLARDPGSEDESLWRKARRDQPPALAPALTFTEDGKRLTGRVTFGRFHVGRGAAHGGAISLVFDEVMGALAASDDRPVARTAYLHVDFRALTPIDEELALEAWFESEEGRKRFLWAELTCGDVLCAEAHGLWVAVREPVGTAGSG